MSHPHAMKPRRRKWANRRERRRKAQEIAYWSTDCNYRHMGPAFRVTYKGVEMLQSEVPTVIDGPLVVRFELPVSPTLTDGTYEFTATTPECEECGHPGTKPSEHSIWCDFFGPDRNEEVEEHIDNYPEEPEHSHTCCCEACIVRREEDATEDL